MYLAIVPEVVKSVESDVHSSTRKKYKRKSSIKKSKDDELRRLGFYMKTDVKAPVLHYPSKSIEKVCQLAISPNFCKPSFNDNTDIELQVIFDEDCLFNAGLMHFNHRAIKQNRNSGSHGLVLI